MTAPRRLNIYLLDDGERWWVVAASKDAALKIYRDDIAGPDDVTCRKLRDNQKLTLTYDDAPAGVGPETKTVSEWVSESQPGILASTEYL